MNKSLLCSENTFSFYPNFNNADEKAGQNIEGIFLRKPFPSYRKEGASACIAEKFMLKFNHGDGNSPKNVFPKRRIFIHLWWNKIARPEWFYLSL
jgi:hypothetical protein